VRGIGITHRPLWVYKRSLSPPAAHFRSSPESGHPERCQEGPERAKSGLMHCNIAASLNHLVSKREPPSTQVAPGCPAAPSRGGARAHPPNGRENWTLAAGWP
jgi:hypothetical protein